MEQGFQTVAGDSKKENRELKEMLEGVSSQVTTLSEAIAKLSVGAQMSVGAPRSSTSTESSTASGPITFTRYPSADADSIDNYYISPLPIASNSDLGTPPADNEAVRQTETVVVRAIHGLARQLLVRNSSCCRCWC